MATEKQVGTLRKLDRMARDAGGNGLPAGINLNSLSHDEVGEWMESLNASIPVSPSQLNVLTSLHGGKHIPEETLNSLRMLTHWDAHKLIQHITSTPQARARAIAPAWEVRKKATEAKAEASQVRDAELRARSVEEAAVFRAYLNLTPEQLLPIFEKAVQDKGYEATAKKMRSTVPPEYIEKFEAVLVQFHQEAYAVLQPNFDDVMVGIEL